MSDWVDDALMWGCFAVAIALIVVGAVLHSSGEYTVRVNFPEANTTANRVCGPSLCAQTLSVTANGALIRWTRPDGTVLRATEARP